MTHLNVQTNQTTKGEVMNLMSNDAHRITYSLYTLTDLICCIISLLMALYSYVGFYGSLIAMLAMFVGMPFMYLAQKRQDVAITEKDRLTDLRINSVQDMLANIKYVKLFVWETLFASRMEKSREQELSCCMQCQTGGVAVGLIFQVNSLIASTACLAWYNGVLGNTLDAAAAFALLSCVDSLNEPLYSVPDMVVDLTQTKAAIGRVKDFLQKKPVPTNQYELGEHEFEWVDTIWKAEQGAETNRLQGSITVQPGELVAVIGPVGSGKTTLLSALAGELYCCSGTCKKRAASITFVTQQAWIRNCSVRENIVLNKEYEAKTYNRIIKACCLEPDFHHLPNGDSTIVGEKGVTLSGGQKSRIQLARAIYQDADIYLLDDILAAVDATVGKQILEQVVFGLLKAKTRIIATHHTHFLSNCDKVAVLHDCKIEQFGAPSQVKHNSIIEEMEKHEVVEAEEKEQETSEDAKDVENEDVTDEETKPDPSLRKQAIWEYIGTYSKFLVALFLALMLLDNLLDLQQDRWVQKWSMDDNNSSTWQYYLKWYIVIVMLNAVARVTMRYIGFVMSTRTAKTYHDKVLKKVTHAALQELEFMPTGKIVNQLTSKMTELDYGYMQQDARDQIDYSISFVLTLCTILYYHPWVLIFLIPVSFATYKIQQNAQQFIQEGREKRETSYDNVYSLVGEAYDGITAFRSMNAVPFMQKQFDDALLLKRKYTSDLCYFDQFVMPTQVQLISSVIVFASAVMGAGNLLVIRQSEKLSTAVQNIISSLIDTESSMLTLVSFQKFFSLQQEQYDSKFGSTLHVSNGEIIFQNVSLKYNEEHDSVLKNLSFMIPSKKRTAVVGRTAAGKTSLLTAMFRLRELTEGCILIDNQDISTVTLESLRTSIGILPQDAYLPAGLLRDALDPYHIYADADVEQALKQVSLGQFSTSMELAENASNISHGEKQLLCMARALLSKRKIIILDEATASVDKETDAKIQATLKSEFNDCTIITIAHRLNTIMDYDWVLVMENGRVAEQGNPLELSKLKNSKFASMLRKQHT